MDFLQQQGIQVKVIPGMTHECNDSIGTSAPLLCVCIQRFFTYRSRMWLVLELETKCLSINQSPAYAYLIIYETVFLSVFSVCIIISF